MLGLLAGREQTALTKPGQAEASEEPAFGEEQEQEQEQQEEQEQEQEQQQQKEQEQEQEEPDEFKREKYSRNEEGLRSWELSALGTPPSDKAHGFYGAREFAVHKSLKETLTGVSDRSGLAFPPHLLFSTDHTNPKWRLSSHRRLKNVLVLLEWLPSGAAAPAPSGVAATAARPHALSDGARTRLQRAVQMYDARGGGGGLGEDALLHALEGFELRPCEEESDRTAATALLAQARGGMLRGEAAVAALHAQDFLRGDAGRCWHP